VAVDDATRLAYAEVLCDERGATAAGFVRRAVAWFERFGITVERVLSDNGSCYRSNVHALMLTELGIRHLFGALHPDAHQPLGLRRDLWQLS